MGCFLSGGGLQQPDGVARKKKKILRSGAKSRHLSVTYRGNDRFFRANHFSPPAMTITSLDDPGASQPPSTGIELEQLELADALYEAWTARDCRHGGRGQLVLCLRRSGGTSRWRCPASADEIFGGYPWNRDPTSARHGFPGRSPRRLRLAPKDGALSGRDLSNRGRALPSYGPRAHALRRPTAGDKRMREMTRLNFDWFMQTCWTEKDRWACTPASRCACPTATTAIAEYLTGCLAAEGVGGQEKGLLRRAMTDILPEPVLTRKKSPHPRPTTGLRLVGEERLKGPALDPGAPLWTLVSGEAEKRSARNPRRTGTAVMTGLRPSPPAEVDYWLRNTAVRILKGAAALREPKTRRYFGCGGVGLRHLKCARISRRCAAVGFVSPPPCAALRKKPFPGVHAAGND